MKGITSLQPSVKREERTLIAALPPAAPSWGQGRGGRPWRRKRLRILERDKYLCQCDDCQANHLVTEADEVDHVVPVHLGGTDDDINLRAINSEHHKLKTARESQGGARNGGGEGRR